MKKAKPMRLDDMFHLDDILENTKLWGYRTDQWFPKIRVGGGADYLGPVLRSNSG